MKEMKAISKKNALTLMIIGMFIIATSQIITRFVVLTDLTRGALLGIGFGLLLLSIIFGNFKTAR